MNPTPGRTADLHVYHAELTVGSGSLFPPGFDPALEIGHAEKLLREAEALARAIEREYQDATRVVWKVVDTFSPSDAPPGFVDARLPRPYVLRLVTATEIAVYRAKPGAKNGSDRETVTTFPRPSALEGEALFDLVCSRHSFGTEPRSAVRLAWAAAERDFRNTIEPAREKYAETLRLLGYAGLYESGTLRYPKGELAIEKEDHYAHYGKATVVPAQSRDAGRYVVDVADLGLGTNGKSDGR